MSFETRRRQLIDKNYNWGDLPRSQRHHVLPPKAREVIQFNRCDDISSVLTASDEDEDKLMTTDKDRFIEVPTSPPKRAISTNGWSFEQLSKTFLPVPRVAVSAEDRLAKIEEHEESGIPLIIEGFESHPDWPENMFSVDWYQANGPAEIEVRNVHDWTDKPMKTKDFIRECRELPEFASLEEKERAYAKDVECPEEWNRWLHETGVIPSLLLPNRTSNLLLNHPQSSSIETLMCYLGRGDTYTPAHKDLCASSGQNLMCYTEGGGSSFWFMTKSSDAPQASSYLHELGQELDHETHALTLEELMKAPFKFYVAEQKLGDLVLVPPRSCHQVVNQGGITIKTSWSRMTIKGLETAYYYELPIYQRVCRSETYRVKSTIHYTLLRQTAELGSDSPSIGPDDLRRMLSLFDAVLVDEYSEDASSMLCLSLSLPPAKASPGPSNASSTTLTPDGGEDGYAPVRCDFCGADIFQSFFECRDCVKPYTEKVLPGDGYVVCAGCYSEGRSCMCRKMDAMQCRPFDELLQDRTNAYKALYEYTRDGSLVEQLDFSLTEGTFKAACLLQKIRTIKSPSTKVCHGSNKGKSHHIESSWTLSCKRCHFAHCFSHILAKYKMHSVDALLHHAADGTHHKYHTRHNSNRSIYAENLEASHISQTRGSPPNLARQRTRMALTYGTCKPVNPIFANAGWYDLKVQVPFRQDSHLAGMTLRPPSKLQPDSASQKGHLHASGNDTTSTQTRTSWIATTERPAAVAASVQRRNHKSEILDYVLIPLSSFRAKPNLRHALKASPAVASTKSNLNNQPEIYAVQPPSANDGDFHKLSAIMNDEQTPLFSGQVQESQEIQEITVPPTHTMNTITQGDKRPRTRDTPLPTPPLQLPASDGRKRKATATNTKTSFPVNITDHDRTSKRTRTDQRSPTKAIRNLRFTKMISGETSQPSSTRMSPEDQLASAYNTAALQNQGMNEEVEMNDADSRPHVNSRSSHQDATCDLHKRLESMEKQLSEIKEQQNSQQQPYPPVSVPLSYLPNMIPDLVQVMAALAHHMQPIFGPDSNQHTYHPGFRGGVSSPTESPPVYRRDRRTSPERYVSRGYHSVPTVSQRKSPPYQYGPPEPGPSFQSPEFQHKHRPSFRGGWRSEKQHIQRHRPPLHRPQANLNNRPLQRLSYERPSPSQQVGCTNQEQTTRYQITHDHSSPWGEDNISQRQQYPWTVTNDRRNQVAPLEVMQVSDALEPQPPPPRLLNGGDMLSPPRNNLARPSQTPVTSELSPDWEDEYEQEDPIAVGENVFKNPSKCLPQCMEEKVSALDDPTVNPWVQADPNTYPS